MGYHNSRAAGGVLHSTDTACTLNFLLLRLRLFLSFQVMLYAGYEYNATGLAACVCTSCKQGETPPQGTPGCPFQRGVPSNLGHPMKQMMAISDSPFGPWHTTEIKALTMSATL